MQAVNIDLSQVGRGFADPVLEAQGAFAAAMWAASRPGVMRSLPLLPEAPSGLSPAMAALVLTLADFETPLWLSPAIAQSDSGAYLRFHTGAPIVENSAQAMFALTQAGEAAALLPRLSIGDERYPDRSATLLIDVPSLDGGMSVTLTGPGVKGKVTIAPAGLDAGFWQAMAQNHQRYPLGVDCFLCAGTDIIGLPRSTAISLRAGN